MASAALPSGQQAAPPADVPTLPLPKAQVRMMMLLIMAATLIQVLDATIANVALPHIKGALNASPDTITWVLTSYIIASAVATPATGWLADRLSRRVLMIVAVGVFTAASVMCAVSTTLPMLVAARLIQGAFGAFVIPLGQSLILDLNPPSGYTRAITTVSIVTMAGPIFGPVVGGWLTDAFNWRWVFLINLPIGVVVTIGLIAFTPKAAPVSRPFDFTGFGLLLVALSSFQLMLDRGSQNDWFASTETVIEAAVALGTAWAFLVHTMTARAPLLPTILFRDRNLVLACVFVLVIVGLTVASSALIPSMLQGLLGHDPMDAGLITVPRGIGMVISMLGAGMLARHINARMLMLLGLVLNAGAVFQMMGFSLDMDNRPLIVGGFIQGLGFGFVVLPVNLIAFATLSPAYRTQAASLFSLARNVGGSVAIAAMSALLVREGQVSHADLGTHLTESVLPVIGTQRFGDMTGAVLGMADAEINRQAAMIAYLDAFWVMFWMIVIVSPLVFLMRPGKKADPQHAAEAAAME